MGTVGLVKAFRLQNLIYCFAFCFIMYRWTQEVTNKYMAVAAVLVAFFLPRMYFSAHIGMLDYPVTAADLDITRRVLEALERSRST